MERIEYKKIDEWCKESGLEPKDMDLRPADIAVRNALGLPTGMNPDDAVVIPYFDMHGKSTTRYRVRILTDIGSDHRYRSPQDGGTAVYFPPGFLKCLEKSKLGYVLMTEGEKKAACLVKYGIPAVGLPGVYGYRSNSEHYPMENFAFKTNNSGSSKGSKTLVVRRKDGNGKPFEEHFVAEWLPDLIRMITGSDLTTIIVFDTDTHGIKEQVQKAAVGLGYLLLEHGVDRTKVKHVVLPSQLNGHDQKVGVDDFIVARSSGALVDLISGVMKQKIAFPRFPQPEGYVKKASIKTPVPAEEQRRIAQMLFVELEYRGQRCMVSNQELYYQVQKEGTVLPVDLPSGGAGSPPPHDSEMFMYLHRQFGLMPHMGRVTDDLSVYFRHPDGMLNVAVSKVSTPAEIDKDDKATAYQISDNKLCLITPHEVKVDLNGSYSTMFTPGHVASLDEEKLDMRIKIEGLKECYWYETLKDSNVIGDKDQRILAYTMYALWLRGWRGLQLPILILQGEQSSGKTSIAELAQTILTGKPQLQTMPTREDQLEALLASTGGLLVLDNVGVGSRKMLSFMQDTLSTLVTSSDPIVSTRRLYTEHKTFTSRVQCSFMITTISNPFRQLDFLSRSLLFKLKPSSHMVRSWVKTQIDRRDCRERWMAHHMVLIQKFFNVYELHCKLNDPDTRGRHRLRGFLPVIEAIAMTFGHDWEWISDHLDRMVDGATWESDQVIQGLDTFKAYIGVDKLFRLRSVVDFIQCSDGDVESLSRNPILTDARRLNDYIERNMQLLYRTLGLEKHDKLDHNAVQYRFRYTENGHSDLNGREKI